MISTSMCGYTDTTLTVPEIGSIDVYCGMQLENATSILSFS